MAGSSDSGASPTPRTLRDRYELREVAGQGGMALVWRGVQRGDHQFERRVAIKQMHPHLADRPLYAEMFAEEARIGVSLHSPNIPQVYDFLCEGDDHFLIMEWVDGVDLGTLLRYQRERSLPTRWELAVAIGIGISKALIAAHERDDGTGDSAPIVHRDVSPHNVLLTPSGAVKLIDFGLSLASDRGRALTEPGIIKGKMSYLSPEVVGGDRPTIAADLWAVGCVLWETLVGRKLFDGATDFDIYRKVREGEVVPLRPLRKDLPRDVVSVVQRALAAQPRNRFQSARELRTALSQTLSGARTLEDLDLLLGQAVREAEAHVSTQADSTTEASSASAAEAPGDFEEPREGRRAITADDALARADRSAKPAKRKKRGLLHQLNIFRGRSRKR